MKKLIAVLGFITIANISYSQEFTQVIKEPVCDTFDLLTIRVVTNAAPENGNHDSIQVYYKKVSTKTGASIEGNKWIANDTALVNQLKRNIILKAKGNN